MHTFMFGVNTEHTTDCYNYVYISTHISVVQSFSRCNTFRSFIVSDVVCMHACVHVFVCVCIIYVRFCMRWSSYSLKWLNIDQNTSQLHIRWHTHYILFNKIKSPQLLFPCLVGFCFVKCAICMFYSQTYTHTHFNIWILK